MATVRAAFSELLAPGLRRIFFQHLKERATQYDKIANMNTSSRAWEEDLEITGLGTMPAKPESTAIIYADSTQGGKVRYTHISFGLGFRVSEEMYEDDLYGPMRRMTRELSKAGRNVREVRFFNLFNNGFTTVFGFPKNGVNEVLFNTAHTLTGTGGTLANRSATDADLGVSSLEAAVLLFRNLTDENGIPIDIRPKHLIVPPSLEMVATEIIGSEFRPGTANNEINAVTRQDSWVLDIVNYLADSDSWFVTADKGDHDLNFFERTPIRFQSGDDFDTGDAKFKAFQRFSVGVGEWRGTFGSLGA